MVVQNGRLDESTMIVLGSGRDDIGPWKHLAPPGTAARWSRLKQLAAEKYRVTLRITPGWNVYRPLNIQVIYRANLGIMAAVPGRSSHGGVFNGRPCMAIDVQNWRDLGSTQAQAWGRFVALCRLVGFTVDFVSPQELWHIGDFAPWMVPAFANVVVKPSPIPTTPQEEVDDMTPEQAQQLADVHAWITSVERGGSGGVQVFKRVPGNPEWMVVDPTLPPLKGTTQDGYRVTTDVNLGRVWGRQYSGQGSEGVELDRDAYNAQQVWARARAAEYRAAQVALIREATGR